MFFNEIFRQKFTWTICQRSASLFCGKRFFSQDFVVRRLTTPQEVRDIMISRAAAEGWYPGTHDHISYFAADSNGYFVGELNGKPISCLSVVKHTRYIAYLGMGIIDREHIGKGYGKIMWNAAMPTIDDTYNCIMDCTTETIGIGLCTGFHLEWYQQCFNFTVPRNLSLEAIGVDDANIVPLSQLLFPAILQYDTEVNDYPRPLFLEKWVFAPNCFCSVATDNKGDVVGYGVVRRTVGKVGWRIAPLYADNSDIARMVYHDMCIKVAAVDPNALMTVDASYGKNFNPNSLKLVKELQGRQTFTLYRLYTKGAPPKTLFHKIFVVTSI